ncbi:CbtB domain-containing protein [Streptomyces albicerus]|uniref:CbtB domain-containing protein n=1 Tax=Streptomyces albicerus TaxID=2569859 RepID=UPI00124AE8C1|nr:CbtB-domain containing protein [Streptomyces albicerus]
MALSNTAVASNKFPTTALSVALAVYALLSVLFLLQENGLLISPEAANYLHEATHDARHALGVPCH